MAAKHRPPTPKELAEDEYRIDHIRGRRRCPVHRHQQMIRLLPGVDICPACPDGESRSAAAARAITPQHHKERTPDDCRT